MYLKKDNLKIYALAGYIIAAKFYDQKKMHTWSLINDAVFCNLGIVYLNSGYEIEKIADNLIKAINYSQSSKEPTKESTIKAEKMLK